MATLEEVKDKSKVEPKPVVKPEVEKKPVGEIKIKVYETKVPDYIFTGTITTLSIKRAMFKMPKFYRIWKKSLKEE